MFKCDFSSIHLFKIQKCEKWQKLSKSAGNRCVEKVYIYIYVSIYLSIYPSINFYLHISGDVNEPPVGAVVLPYNLYN